MYWNEANAHALALHDVGNNLGIELENKKAINAKYIDDITEINTTKRELECQLEQLQKCQKGLLDDVDRAKQIYEETRIALSEEQMKRGKEIKDLLLLIEEKE